MSKFADRIRSANKGRKRNPPSGPLRKIVGYVKESIGHHDTLGEMFIDREELECGHIIPIKQDMFGETNATRRRCRKCGEGKESDA